MFLNRAIKLPILESLLPNKVVVLLGPRRVGKTILIKQLLEEVTEPYLFLNGEDVSTRELFARRSVQNFLQWLDGKLFLVIDEAQKIPDIGNCLKLMVDEIEGLKILITGSSAFDVKNDTGEPLTGRKYTFNLYPLSEQEVKDVYPISIKKDKFRERLIYGSYPELLQLSSKAQKNRYLNELLSSYLMKDILAFENIKSADKILSLLKLLAFQVGQSVSTSELGTQLGMSGNTVLKYLDLLSKVFIIYKLSGFSRNLRKEITKSNKWYFFDNGIRNILIANLNAIELRNDIGQLWENYIISERIKYQQYQEMIVNNYYWRTYDQQEIDWIEERGGNLHAYEFKWNTKKRAKIPGGWKKNYVDATFETIHPDNYISWVGV